MLVNGASDDCPISVARFALHLGHVCSVVAIGPRQPENNPRAHGEPLNASKFVRFSLSSGPEQGTRMTKLACLACGSAERGAERYERSAITSTSRYFVACAGAVLLYAILPPTNVITGLMSLI
jgi:hypothetical protein